MENGDPAARGKKPLGEAKFDLDDLIDPKLADLAREYCICLRRDAALREYREGLEAERAGERPNRGKGANSDGPEDTGNHGLYGGTIRFQTLFNPTRDTRLRF